MVSHFSTFFFVCLFFFFFKWANYLGTGLVREVFPNQMNVEGGRQF